MDKVPAHTNPIDAGRGGPREQPINREVAFESVDRDLELLREVVALSLEDLPRLLENIRISIDQGDMPSLEHWAHTLKGSVANFGAERALGLAFDLETLARNAGSGKVGAAYQELEAQVGAVMAALRDLVREEAA